MQELEKRCGLNEGDAKTVREEISARFPVAGLLHRTVIVKVDNDDFSPDPKALLDIKIKLVENDTFLSVKTGSWHGDTMRHEFEVRFNRTDLANLLHVLTLLSFDKFIVLNTIRTIWKIDGLTATLDDYPALRRSLFEIEATSPYGEQDIDNLYKAFDVVPMSSAETIDFIRSINATREIQFDLATSSPDALVEAVLASHTCD